MKTLIVYGSKYGTTKKSTQSLAKLINGEVTITPLPAQVELDQYDNILIGSPIYLGKIRKEVIEFINNNKAQLLTKKLGLYICSAFGNTEEFSENFDGDLLRSSVCRVNLGYEFDTKKFNLFEKLLAKAIPADQMQAMGISDEKITVLANSMNGAMNNV